MQDISEKILSEISDKNIKPTPKVIFSLIDYSFWVVFGLAVALGICVVFTIIMLISAGDWDVYPAMGYNFWTYLFSSLPYLWFLALIGFLFSAFWAYRATKKGYKRPAIIVLTVLSVTTLVLVAVCFELGADLNLHKYMMGIPMYDRAFFSREDMWCCGERGFLGGTITDVPDNFDFMLRDFSGKIWIVKTEHARIFPGMLIQPDWKVRVMGEEESNDVFIANDVRPWGDWRKR